MGDIRWFSLGIAEKLSQAATNEHLTEAQGLLSNQVYGLFEKNIQVAHLQLHHYCQPRQNETLQGRNQFDEKNSLTLEPVITRLEELFSGQVNSIKKTYVYLHVADTNLDELIFKRNDLLLRLKSLTASGFLKIAGGILDESFIGPDAVEFSVAAIMAYYDKITQLFGEEALAPIIWIPERFFEEKTAAIINEVYDKYVGLQRFPYLSIVVDENVVEHSFPAHWQGNVFSGWENPNYKNLKVFVSSNHLRAIMPQATPAEVNEVFFNLMKKTWKTDEQQTVSWFINEYEKLILSYAELNNATEDKGIEIEALKININRFYLQAREKLEQLDPLYVFFVDDLEKNGSWKGTYQFAFEERNHFFHYLKQATNIFNPYQMRNFLEYTPKYKTIDYIKPSSYKEFSIIWNNNPLSVEKWREMTIIFMRNNVNSVEEIENLSPEKLNELKILNIEKEWYLDFIRTPISWQEGQLTKYPEIKLNYILAQVLYTEITGVKDKDAIEIYKSLMDDTDIQGQLLHIWNKNRASCPNFIGFFGGNSISFFRMHIAAQLASILTLKYSGISSLEKDLYFEEKDINIHWLLIKLNGIFKIIDEKGDTLFMFNEQNLHNLVNGFSRHREGYNSIIKKFASGRTDADNFALIDRGSGTTSSHPLVVALDLERMDDLDIIQKTYPEDLDDFDNEQCMLGAYPVAWEQVWILPPNTFENPVLNYQEGYYGDFRWLTAELYHDEVNGQKIFTFVRQALYQGRRLDVIKKIDSHNSKVRVEVWNRSNNDMQMNPTIAFPTSLDWYEGANYEVENEPFPLKGDVRCYDKSSIHLSDKISNIKLTISANRQDVRYSLTTVYTYQTSDKGAYTVCPQHELILLSSREVVSLQPGEGYIVEYEVRDEALTSEPTWEINWEAMPQLLKTKVHQFANLFLQEQNLTDYQKIKLIYTRYPEIIFWVK